MYAGHPGTAPFLCRFTWYFEQIDTLIPQLAPREMLMYTAELKQPRDVSGNAKRAIVESVLDKLGLRGCADVRIRSAFDKGISGGQMKRTNIGIAIVTSPRVLFLGTNGNCIHTCMVVVTATYSLFRSIARSIAQPTKQQQTSRPPPWIRQLRTRSYLSCGADRARWHYYYLVCPYPHGLRLLHVRRPAFAIGGAPGVLWRSFLGRCICDRIHAACRRRRGARACVSHHRGE